MATIKPFRALRPTPGSAAGVAALPYDVYSRAEAKEEIVGKPHSFLRVDRAEATMDDSVDAYAPEVYRQAKENLLKLEEEGHLIKEGSPALYLYEQEMDGRRQTGIVAVCKVDEYLDSTIKRHEQTRADKELDRVRHVDALDANTGPIFLTYRARDDIKDIVSDIKRNPPLFSFRSDDGVGHAVWIIKQKDEIESLIDGFNAVESLYIADGHHRCASAVKVAEMRRAENPGYSGEEEFNYFLSVIFPDDELRILDYNRVVKDLAGLEKKEFLEEIGKKFDIIESGEQVRPEEKAEFGMYLDGKWYRLRFKGPVPDDEVARLDVSLLQDNILAPLLKIGDPRTDDRIDFIGGIRGLGELENRVDGGMAVAFSMRPTEITELMDVADSGRLMPPKSTWFEPKLRSGLFIHELSEAE